MFPDFPISRCASHHFPPVPPHIGIEFGIDPGGFRRDVRLLQLSRQHEDVEIRGHDDHQGAQGVHREDRQLVTDGVAGIQEATKEASKNFAFFW